VYLYEPRRGKAFAVNRGAAAAKEKVCAFTDNDVIVTRQWLANILHEFDQDPGLGMLAGCVLPAEENRLNVAVTRSLERTTLNDLLSLEGMILGCNLAVRPAVLARVRGRDTRLGPGRGLSCEDIDFAYRVLRSGYRGVFSPDPVVYHDPGDRNRNREYLRGWGAFYLKFLLVGDRKVARQVYWRLCGICRELFRGGIYSRETLNTLWHLLAGASIMFLRIVQSRRVFE
jgi:GT2 family glycosyltransferase